MVITRKALVVAWLLLSLTGAVALKPNLVITVSGSRSNIYAAGISRSVVANEKLVYIENNPELCSANDIPAVDERVVFLAKRGTCNFSTKAEVAKAAGAQALIVFNDRLNLYNATTRELLNPCTLDCNLGSSIGSPEACESSSKCLTNNCMSPQLPEFAATPVKFCCSKEPLIEMDLGKAMENTDFSVMYVTSRDGSKLRETSFESRTVSVRFAPEGSIWPIGVMAPVIAVATVFRACQKYRFRLKSPFWEEESVGDPIGDFGVQLSSRILVGLVVLASVELVVIFVIVSYYPHALVMIFQVIFVLASIVPFATYALSPILELCQCNRMFRPTVPAWNVIINSTKVDFDNTMLCASLISLVVSVVWFLCRHESWIWILHDAMAASIVCVALTILKVYSLRDGSLMLGLFFVYDVFMTFISPLLFKGKSVMVEVATAGKATERVVRNTCERVEGENIPFLFLFPTGIGGFSILGLGDVVIPGIFLCYCLRLDYLKLLKRQKEDGIEVTYWELFKNQKYYNVGCVAYLVGLVLALLANKYDFTVFGVQGQPALLYLTPSVVGAVCCRAWCLGELDVLWSTPLQDMEDETIEDEAEGAAMPMLRTDEDHDHEA